MNTCWFSLDPLNVPIKTVFDPVTGVLNFQKLDGVVNNFNKVILAALQCNVDISFIRSGPDAKAILFYESKIVAPLQFTSKWDETELFINITDYITKSQLPVHVAYAMLKLAVKKLEDVASFDLSTPNKAKKLLRKCTNSLIVKQELSVQQVAGFLLGNDAKYTSHSLQHLY